MAAVLQKRGRLVARVVLGLLTLYGVLRVADPEARWAAGRVPGDRIEHALLVYGLMTCALAAFPRLSPLAIAGGMLALGVAVEVVQAIPGVPGGFQLADLFSDLAGILLAIAPFILGRAHADHARTARSPAAQESSRR